MLRYATGFAEIAKLCSFNIDTYNPFNRTICDYILHLRHSSAQLYNFSRFAGNLPRTVLFLMLRVKQVRDDRQLLLMHQNFLKVLFCSLNVLGSLLYIIYTSGPALLLAEHGV